MPEISYAINAKMPDGPLSAHGRIQFAPWTKDSAEENSGVVRIRPELPSCELNLVKAILTVKPREDEKIFMNGYQTWTFCPEYTANDRIRGLQGLPKSLIDHYGLDRYGDYLFTDYPYKKGLTHGESWCYFRKGSHFRLVASLNERPGYTQFSYDAAAGQLILLRDCRGVKAEGVFPAFDLFIAEGSETEVFDAWFRALGIKCPPQKKLVGYSSWYNRYEDISEELILRDLEGCRKVLQPGDLFQVDDGWEVGVGDWLAPDKGKFPDGMKFVADNIHEAGFKAGLWLAPFVVSVRAALYREHPDWMLTKNRQPWRCGCNWDGFYSLDIDKPEVTEYLKACFRRVFDDWGFDLVKLDFLYGAAPFGSDKESRAGRMYRAMEFLRECCGDRLILGCGVPVMPAFGLVDYCRVSCDVTLDWDDKFYMKIVHRERNSTRRAILTSLYRRELNGRAYGSDPDVFFLRDENLRLSPARKTLLAEMNALFGTVYLTSDDMNLYDAEKIREFARLRHLAEAAKDVRVTESGGVYTVHYTLDGEAKSFPVPV